MEDSILDIDLNKFLESLNVLNVSIILTDTNNNINIGIPKDLFYKFFENHWVEKNNFSIIKIIDRNNEEDISHKIFLEFLLVAKKLFLPLNKIYKALTQGNDNYYAVILMDFIPESERDRIYQYIEKNLLISNGKATAEELQTKEQVFSDIKEKYFKNYSCNFFDSNEPNDYLSSTEKYIGERDKKKRICRFCNKKEPDVTFKKIAHAISESLGNKRFFLREECDSCNEFFGNTIEPDFNNILQLYSIMYGTKGKKRIPEINGKNFHMKYLSSEDINSIPKGENLEKNLNDKPLFVIQLPEGSMETGSNGEPKSIRFPILNKYIPQNIYKCLCKFALSLIDTDTIELKNFSKTMDWLSNKKDVLALPIVKMSIVNSKFTKKPTVHLYTRNNSQKNMPFLFCEFSYLSFVYIYIVPTFDPEIENDFTQEIYFDEFWNSTFYNNISVHWKDLELNTNEKIGMQPIWNFERTQQN